MGIYKIIGIALVGLSLTCCNRVPAEQYDELLEKYHVLKEASNIANEDVVRQYKNINNILQRMERLSGQITVVRRNIEGTPISEIELIHSHADAIEKELIAARGATNQTEAPELHRMIAHLQNTVKERQAEIIELKIKIDELSIEINELSTEVEVGKEVINQQAEFIQQQYEEIKQAHEEIKRMQMNAWYDMGIELYNVYIEYNDISGGLFNNRNRQRMDANKRNVLLKAKNCFQQAVNLGHTDGRNQINAIDVELSSM
jgi:predicted  nucleic acid-binding Zn-ribbon protein